MVDALDLCLGFDLDVTYLILNCDSNSPGGAHRVRDIIQRCLDFSDNLRKLIESEDALTLDRVTAEFSKTSWISKTQSSWRGPVYYFMSRLFDLAGYRAARIRYTRLAAERDGINAFDDQRLSGYDISCPPNSLVQADALCEYF